MLGRILMMAAVGLWALTNAQDASAQSAPEARTQVSGLISGLIGDGGPRPMFGLSAGYRLTRYAGFEFDASYAGRLSLGEVTRNLIIPPGGSLRPGDTLVCANPDGCPIIQRWHDRGNLFVVTTNAVVNLTDKVPRLRPYLVAGAGAGNLSRDIDYISPADQSSTTARNTDTRPVFDAGGGLEFQRSGGLGIGIDARYFQFFGSDSDLRFVRLGARLSYRF